MSSADRNGQISDAARRGRRLHHDFSQIGARLIRSHFLSFALGLTLVTAVSFSAHAQWHWQNPKPQGNDLWNISFAPSSTQGWAVGGAGMIIMTTNGGSNWSTQESGTQEFLRGVCAESTSHVWAVGDNGMILVTSDGGNTWTIQNANTTDGFNQIFAVDANTAWICGDAGLILVTTNGGSTWTAQTTGTSNNINDICFADAQNGWAVGSQKTFLRTTNGGATWTSQTPMGPVIDMLGLFFLNAQKGWAVGGFGRVFLTTNAGATWQAANITGTTDDLNKVLFLDQQTGVAVGENGAMIRSTNGGLGWMPVTSGVSTGLEGLAHCTGATVAVGVFGEILRAALSLTFTRVLSGSQATFNAIASFGDQRAWAAGDGGIIYATTNGGSSWTTQSSGTTNTLYAAEAIDAQTVVVAGNGGVILRTTNGGGAWSAVPSGVAVAINGMDFPTPTIGIACGLSGKIIKTTDGGLTWSVLPSGTLSALYGIDMQDADFGTIVGAGGLILRTTNGGQLWTQQNSFTQDALFSVALMGNSGWICGDVGTILTTTDDGQNWNDAVTNVTDALFHLVQSSPNDLAAVGDNGVILRTSDAGATWASEISHDMWPMYSGCASGSTVWTCGDVGGILNNTAYPMPVDLQSFTARRVDDDEARLAWRTGAESDNLGFEIQRRLQGDWAVAGFVPACANPEGDHEYSFIDRIPEAASGTLQYRLRQIDTDGSVWFSPVVELAPRAVGPSQCAIRSYPSPARDRATVEIAVSREAEPIALVLLDLTGREVLDVTARLHAVLPATSPFGAAFTVDLSGLASHGIHFWKLVTAAGVSYQPVMILPR
jgi:photosystem II stability/assembly factor-like uncharacterized protein